MVPKAEDAVLEIGTGLGAAHAVDPAMAQYLYHHAGEELGHDKWAEADLMDLGLSAEQISKLQPSSACLQMMGLEYLYAAHLNPVGLFGWIFVLDSLGAQVGGTLAAAVEKALQLNGRGLYFLKGHAEAEAHYAEDLYRIIGRTLARPTIASPSSECIMSQATYTARSWIAPRS